jgi:biopolymer transport protein ExbD
MPLKTHIDEPPTLNLTAMIDILFLLIIFFMVSTQFTQYERNLALEVPHVAEGAALTAIPESRIVNVYKDGHVTLDEEDVSLPDLTARLQRARSQYADLRVVVRGDGAGRFQRVAEVLNACKAAGIGQLAISVKLAEEQGAE